MVALIKPERSARRSELHVVKEALHTLEPGVLLGVLLIALILHLELPQKFPLALGQINRRLHHNTTHQVARLAAPYRHHALATQTEQFAGLGLCRNLQLDPTVQGRHFELATQRSIGKGNGHLAIEVLAVALEDLVLAHRHLNIQIAGRTAIDPLLPFACQADPVSGIHARRNLHGQGLLILDIASAMTGLAGITDDLARAATTRTGLLDGEKSLLHADLARTMAGSTGFWPATTFRTAALTGTAFHMRRHTNFDVRAAHRIFQVKLQGIAQITAAIGTGTP